MTQKQTPNKKKEEFVCVPKKQAASGQHQQQQQKNIQHKIKYNIFRSAENMCILAIYVICVDIYIYIYIQSTPGTDSRFRKKFTILLNPKK